MNVLDDFITDARAVPLEIVFELAGGQLGRKRANEYVGPCPACGGRDRFAINFVKGKWFCRQYDGGRGGDGLALMAHVHDLDLRRRDGMMLACSEVQGGRPIPDGGERETDAERAAREARIAARRASTDAKRAKDEKAENVFREKEIGKARGIYLNARDAAGTDVETYLCLRTGAKAVPAAVWESLRFHPQLTYWEGKDDRGNPRDIHCGPAMVVPMVDVTGHITGCHQTWIDLTQRPKFRPDLGSGDDGERLPTKKMRGHSKGSLIPVLGDLDAARWVVVEGIETTFAIALVEGWRGDTFYAAAGSLGNMAGPADPSSAFNHPHLKVADSRGRVKPVRIAGPVPKAGSDGDAFPLPSHVTELLLGTDGDSELYFTISAMARAEARLMRDGLTIVHLPRFEGGDYSETTSQIYDGTALAA